MGRKLLADPELPKKLLEGRREDVRPCIYQYRCIGQIFLLEPFRCAANPAMGHEAEFELEPAATARHVLVAGGGPGGLETARVAALRGHRVTLCEETEELGGTALLSSLVNEPNGELVEYLVTQVRKLRVTVRLNQEVTPALVRELRPDVVVVATGARHDTSALRGADRPNVFNGHDLRLLITGRDPVLAASKLSLSQRALLGVGRLVTGSPSMERLRELTRRWMPLGKRVTVIGGGLVGAELAEFLADRGRQVTIVEAGPVIGKEMALPRRWRAIHELRERGVVLLTEAAVAEITDAGVGYVDKAAVQKTVAADSVILAYGMVEDRSLAEAITGVVPEVHVVGDCHGVGYIEGALRDATLVAMKI
jgi:2,4-dienoyl-CoA reductase (NADPH2)